jgi:hypothetical protein
MIVSPRKSPNDRSVFVFFSAAKNDREQALQPDQDNLAAKTAVAVTSVCRIGQARRLTQNWILTALFVV